MPVAVKMLAFAFAVTAIVGSTVGPVLGQDSHYWTEQYGERSQLLSGSVIGSVNDVSAVYYNPGALGYLEKPEISLTLNAFRLLRVRVKDGAGEGLDLSTLKFNPVPGLFAGAFRFNFYGPNRLAYSILARHRFKVRLQEGNTGEFELDPDTPGSEVFAGGLFGGVDISDVWFGLTWARALREHIGFGVTTFFSIRSQEAWDEVFVQTQTQTGEIALVDGTETFDATMYSLLWKFGLGFDFRPISAGITLTTPNIRIAGSGTAALNETRIGVDVDGDSIPDDGFSTDLQKDVRSNYKYPLSIGIGAAWHLETSKLHFSAEWFDNVDSYAVLELVPFESQTTGETIDRTLTQKLDSVVNFGAGVEQRLGSTYTGYLGFNTDRSAYNPESEVSVTRYDIYHVSGGGKAQLEKARFTVGLRYSWGSQTVEQSINLNPEDGGDVLEQSKELNLDFRQLGFLVGFSLDF